MHTSVKILIFVSGLCLFSLSVADDLCDYCSDYRNFDMVLPETTVPRDQGYFMHASYDKTAAMPERIAVHAPVHMSWMNISDSLCTYCDDMSAYGTPRSGYVTPHQMPVLSHQVRKTASVSPVVLVALVQAARGSAFDDLCDYCGDSNTYLHRVSQSIVQPGRDKPGFVEKITPKTTGPLTPRAENENLPVPVNDGLCDYCGDFSFYDRAVPVLLHAGN